MTKRDARRLVFPALVGGLGGPWRRFLIALAVSLGPSASSHAQPLGSFSWQVQPFCNVLTVNVTQQGALFTIDGYDDQCAAGQRAPLVGVATQNPDGTIGFGLHVVTVPGGRPVDIDARIALATLSGTWSDSAGNSGTFAFNSRTGGSARPVPTVPASAIAPASITGAQLATAAVGTTNIADGSVTPQKLSGALPKLNWSGLTTGVLALTPNASNIVVRTVTMTIPAAGRVLVEASGLFGFTTQIAQNAWCSISTGTTVETDHYLYARVELMNNTSNIPFAGSRVYDVTPGSFTVNLVCSGSSSFPLPSFVPTLQTAQLTALFVPS